MYNLILISCVHLKIVFLKNVMVEQLMKKFNKTISDRGIFFQYYVINLCYLTMHLLCHVIVLQLVRIHNLGPMISLLFRYHLIYKSC